MRTATDYPKLIKTLKEEIQGLKGQLSQEIDTSMNSSTASLSHEVMKKDALVKQCSHEVEALRTQLQSQREATKSLSLRVSLAKRVYSEAPPPSSRPADYKQSLRVLADKLRVQLADVEQKTRLLNGGSFVSDDVNTSRVEQASAKKSANEQFTQLQKRATALEQRNSALRERMKTVEAERQRLEDNYQNAMSRAKGDVSVLYRRENLEQAVAEKEHHIAALRQQIANAKSESYSRVDSPTRQTAQTLKDLQSKISEAQKTVSDLKESVRYWQSKVTDIETSPKRTQSAQTLASRLKAESKRIEDEIQLTSKLIREKDKEILQLELTSEQLKSDIDRGKADLGKLNLKSRSPHQTNSSSPINRSVATVKQLEMSPQGGNTSERMQYLHHIYATAEKQSAAKRSESLLSLQKSQRSSKGVNRPVGMASKIVALNRGQFESASKLVIEPDAVFEWEKNDEVAESAKRLRWLSCLRITHSAIFLGNLDLKPTLLTSKHSRSKTLARIKADILLKCVSKIAIPRAEEIMSELDVDLDASDIREMLSGVTMGYDDPNKDVSLTLEHRALYMGILAVGAMQEMKRTDDGFEDGPLFEDDIDLSFEAEPALDTENPAQVPFATLAGGASVGLLGIGYIGKTVISVGIQTPGEEGGCSRQGKERWREK